MLKVPVTTFLCLGMLYAFSQVGEEKRITASGEIADSSHNPISYAHILVKSRNQGCIADLYGKFHLGVFPGDTLIVTAVSFHPETIPIPAVTDSWNYNIRITMQKDTVNLKEVEIYPWPGTYSQLRREFLKVSVKDPKDDIDLKLPSTRDIVANLKTPGVPGQIGLYSGPGLVSILYDKFSKEARSRKILNESINREKAGARYNMTVVSKITGLKEEDEILKFMEFCALQVRFILESTDYEIYAAILDCYNEFCSAGYLSDPAKE